MLRVWKEEKMEENGKIIVKTRCFGSLRMEKWKGRRVERWKGRRMEKWNDGRVERWKDGKVKACQSEIRNLNSAIKNPQCIHLPEKIRITNRENLFSVRLFVFTNSTPLITNRIQNKKPALNLSPSAIPHNTATTGIK